LTELPPLADLRDIDAINAELDLQVPTVPSIPVADSDSDEEELENMEEEDEFSENDCTCPVCRVMNNIYTRWENWTPNTLFEKTIKKHIDKI